MGMSAAENTLPHQLVSQKVINTRIFALCFSIGGGIMTLGGVDQSIHTHGKEIKYAKLTKSKGWFTVNLLDISMRPSKSSNYQKQKIKSENLDSLQPSYSIGANHGVLNGKKGVIVDSGTTDTYLPLAIKKSFEELFKKITGGLSYSNTNIGLNSSQFDALPTFVYKVEGIDGTGPIEIETPPSSYMEKLRSGKYACRVYLTEASGAVLGANVMNGHNVIFDIDARRIGFVSSKCSYDDHDKKEQNKGGKGHNTNKPLKSVFSKLSDSTPNEKSAINDLSSFVTGFFSNRKMIEG
jgi:hypothetical protein